MLEEGVTILSHSHQPPPQSLPWPLKDFPETPQALWDNRKSFVHPCPAWGRERVKGGEITGPKSSSQWMQRQESRRPLALDPNTQPSVPSFLKWDHFPKLLQLLPGFQPSLSVCAFHFQISSLNYHLRFWFMELPHENFHCEIHNDPKLIIQTKPGHPNFLFHNSLIDPCNCSSHETGSSLIPPSPWWEVCGHSL